jgi:uncharacterized phage infection (PIP) family protein YhgE
MLDNETLNQTVEQATNAQENTQEKIENDVQQQESPKENQGQDWAQPDPTQKPSPVLENNIRALRESKERIQRERDEMAQRLKEFEMRANPQAPEEDLSLNLGENDLAEGKHLTKIQKQLNRQREELIKAQQQTQSLLIETRLKAEHPDIDKVVTVDNIKSLSELYPEIAQTLNSSSDYYSKAKAAYTMIKKFGIHVEDTFAPERELAQRNAAKPRPLASVSPQQADSPLSRANAFANGLTEELKVQLRKEMEEATRNL